MNNWKKAFLFPNLLLFSGLQRSRKKDKIFKVFSSFHFQNIFAILFKFFNLKEIRLLYQGTFRPILINKFFFSRDSLTRFSMAANDFNELSMCSWCSAEGLYFFTFSYCFLPFKFWAGQAFAVMYSTLSKSLVSGRESFSSPGLTSHRRSNSNPGGRTSLLSYNTCRRWTTSPGYCTCRRTLC